MAARLPGTDVYDKSYSLCKSNTSVYCTAQIAGHGYTLVHPAGIPSLSANQLELMTTLQQILLIFRASSTSDTSYAILKQLDVYSETPLDIR